MIMDKIRRHATDALAAFGAIAAYLIGMHEFFGLSGDAVFTILETTIPGCAIYVVWRAFAGGT